MKLPRSAGWFSVLTSRSATLTILIPKFHGNAREFSFTTLAITTPFSPTGDLQKYSLEDELQGTAKVAKYMNITDAAKRPLKVVLGLVWAHDDVYRAKVSVTIVDTCYVAGDLQLGLPP